MASINVKEMTNLQKLVPQPFAWPPCELTSPVLLSACLLLFQIPLSTLSLNKLLQDQQAFQLNHYHLHTDKVGTVHQLRSNLIMKDEKCTFKNMDLIWYPAQYFGWHPAKAEETY